MNILCKSFIASAALASIVALSVSSASAQTAEYIIFEVKGDAEGLSEKFVLGAVLKVGDRIDLPKGAEVRLLDKGGAVVVLSGPIAGTVTNEDESEKAQKGSNALHVIAKLMFGEKKLVNNLGAARGLGKDGADAGTGLPWVPVLSKPGTYCLPMDLPVFARAHTSKKAKITVIATGGVFNEKDWNKNEKTISLSDLIVKGTDSYTLLFSSQVTKSSFHLLDRTGLNTAEQIAWMAERGCAKQAIQLLQEASAGAK